MAIPSDLSPSHPEGDVIVTYGERKIEQGKEPDFEALWAEMQRAVRNQPGFIAARLLRSENHGGVYAQIEYWADQESQKQAYERDDVRAIAGRLFTERMTRMAPVTEYCAVVAGVGEVPAH